MYIVKEKLIGDAKERVLKLDRDAKKLVVYKRVDNERLHDYYSIREDFDSSPYAMYEEEKSFDCIYGGKESPTPAGTFTIEYKSKDEYISGYYKKLNKVKFFGYLIIFEDYFIHSDLYEESVTMEDMRSNPDIQPVSKGDDHTFGCIRVKQDELDWLLENVDVGTMVVM